MVCNIISPSGLSVSVNCYPPTLQYCVFWRSTFLPPQTELSLSFLPCNFSARTLVPEHLSDHLFILFHPVCYATESFLINVSIRTTQDISNHSYKKNIDFKIASSLQGPYLSSFLFFFFSFFLFFLLNPPIAVQKWSTFEDVYMWRCINYKHKWI